MDTDCVLCEVWSEILYIIQMNENSAPFLWSRCFNYSDVIVMLLLTEGRAGEAWEPSNKEMPPRLHGQLKFLPLLLDFPFRYLASNLSRLSPCLFSGYELNNCDFKHKVFKNSNAFA
jgi:hypothetical protein